MSYQHPDLPSYKYGQYTDLISTLTPRHLGDLDFVASLRGQSYGVVILNNVSRYTGTGGHQNPYGTFGYFTPGDEETTKALGATVAECLRGPDGLDPSDIFNRKLAENHTSDTEYRSVVPNGADFLSTTLFVSSTVSPRTGGGRYPTRQCIRIDRGEGKRAVSFIPMAEPEDWESFLRSL